MKKSRPSLDAVITEVEADLDGYEEAIIEGLAQSSGQVLPAGWREDLRSRRSESKSTFRQNMEKHMSDQKKRDNVAAGHKASATKGKDEEIRAANMAAWTRKNGKNDALNPFSKANTAVETKS